jgi:hypothetical protein
LGGQEWVQCMANISLDLRGVNVISASIQPTIFKTRHSANARIKSVHGDNIVR